MNSNNGMKRKWPFYIDSFSGSAADLPRDRRSQNDVLDALAKDGRVSTFDMSEYTWLRDAVGDLKSLGHIEAKDAAYPWHRYVLTDAGYARLKGMTDADQA